MLLVGVGFAYLPFMRLLFLGMSYVAFPIGWTTSHILLAVIFLVLTPVGLVLKAAGRDSMERRLDRSASTYWVAHPQDEDPSRYFRQF